MEKEFKKYAGPPIFITEGGKRFILDDENEIAVFRIDENFYVVDNICPHNHTAQMYDGHAEEMYVACPVHGYRFHLETGEQPTGQGCRLRTFDMKIADDNIYVRIPEERRFDFSY